MKINNKTIPTTGFNTTIKLHIILYFIINNIS